MADTGRSEPLVNGNVEAMDDEEKAKIRPADIDADVREMERRKRVEMVMNSRLFREELERIIDTQMKDGNGPSGLLQQLSEMMGVGHGRPMQARSGSCVAPINDIRGVESMGYAKGEKIVRCKLAAVFRLMDLYGWTHGIGSQITARLNQEHELFLVNPFGVLFNEVTASSLVKLDMQAAVVEQGTTNFGVNAGAFLVHSALYAARPDVKCVVHVVTPSVLSVSALKAGLLPLCQEAAVLGEASVHHYSGGALGPEGRDKMARDLGPVNKVLLLSNHGALCCGETVEEAFFHVYNLALACDTQMKLLPLGVDNLVLMGDEARKAAFDAARRAPDAATPAPESTATTPRKEKQWRVGATHFEALMRMLDNAGFRTGYVYRSPLIRAEPPRPRNDIELPPAVASLGYLFDEDDKNGPWRKYVDGRKTHDRTRWLNSPNVYQKVEILETGTPDPRKITKWVESNAEEWVADGSPTHSSTPVKIDSALQFVPKNTHPREFKKLQQQIKDNRRADKITSGPQSHILEGVSWEEAKKLQDAGVTQAGEQVILVGAASKGIIQRGFQHNATVYKTPYAKNPFDAVTDDDLEEYKRSVQRHTKGESFEEEQSESEALSSSLRRGLASPNTASETEEESRDEPRVLRIETKLVPRASQAEVVLSDAADFPDSGFERSKSLRHSGQAASGGRSAGDFFRSFSLGPAQRKKGARHEPAGKPSRAPPPLTSRQPLHFHVARLSAAPRVLHTSRLPQSGQGLKLSNLVDRRIKLAGGVVTKPSDSYVGLGTKNTGLKSGENSTIPVPGECTSPNNPFNGPSQLDDSAITNKLADSQSKPNESYSTDVLLCPGKEVAIPDVSNKEAKEDVIHINQNFLKPSVSPRPQRSGLSRSQHLKLLKLRFLELYPTVEGSTNPPPVPPKLSRPESLESEGYWSTSMVSLASMNSLDQSRLNRDFDAQLGRLEFSPMMGNAQAIPPVWDSARLECCQQGLAKELAQIDNLLEEIGAEGLALQEQLLDLLPRWGHCGDNGGGEESLGEESANYLDGDVSFLQFVGLDETCDTIPPAEGFKKDKCVHEDRNINGDALVNSAADVLLDKSLVNTDEILLEGLDQNKCDLLCKGDNAGSIEIAPKNARGLILSADDYLQVDCNVLESNTESSRNVDQWPFDPKVGLVGEMDTTVGYIDESLVIIAQVEDALEVDALEPDQVEPIDENVYNDSHANDVTDKTNKEVSCLFDTCQNDESVRTNIPQGDDNLVADADEEEFAGTSTNCIASNNYCGESDEVDEIVSVSEKETVDIENGGVDSERNSTPEDAVSLIAGNISDASTSFTDEESDANNNDIEDDNNFISDNSAAEIDGTSTAEEHVYVEPHFGHLKDADDVFNPEFKKARAAHERREDVECVLHLPLPLDNCNIPYAKNRSSMPNPMGHWRSLENGASSGSEEEFDIAKHFPEPVRPLQYDDEEYIRKPFKPKRIQRVTVDEEEEDVDNETSRKLEEAIVDLAEAVKPVKVEYLSELIEDSGHDGYLCEPTGDDGRDGYLCEPAGDNGHDGYLCEPMDDGGNDGYLCEPTGDDGRDGYLCEPSSDDGHDGYSCEPMDDGGEEGYIIDGVSFEEFFDGIEEDMSKFFAEEMILHEGERSRSEFEEDKGNIGEVDLKEHLIVKPSEECYDEQMATKDNGDDDLNEIVCTAEDDLNICENEEFVTKNGTSDDGIVNNESYVKNDELLDAHSEHDSNASEDCQQLVCMNDTQVAESSDNQRLIDRMKEGLSENLGVVNMIKEELAIILGSISYERRPPDSNVLFMNIDEKELIESVDVIDLDKCSYNGEEDHISSEKGDKFATSLEISASEYDKKEINLQSGNKDDIDTPDLSDFEEVFISDYMFDADRSNSDSDPDGSVFKDDLVAGQNLDSGSAHDLHMTDNGAGDAAPLFDPLDMEVCRLNGSFIPIDEPSPQYSTRSCCLHILTTSSDSCSTNESTDFTSPSDGEYDDEDIPPRAAAQLSLSCRSVLETPLHYSFHIRDENNESLELPPSPRPRAKEMSIGVTNRQSNFVLTLEQEVQEFEMLGELIRGSPIINEEKETGQKTQSKTIEEETLFLNPEKIAVETINRHLSLGQTLEEVEQKTDNFGEAMMGCSASDEEEEAGFHSDLRTPEHVEPECVWIDAVAGFEKTNLDGLLEQQNPGTIILDDTEVDEVNEAIDPSAESNSPAGSSKVLASSWCKFGKLWSLVSYTEYEPLGNSTTTSQLGFEGPSSVKVEDVLEEVQSETEEDSATTSPFVSCGSGLSSQRCLSSPDSCRDPDERNPQDHPIL